MPAPQISRTATAADWKRLLGRTGREIASVMGDPFAIYSFRDEEIYLYDSMPPTTISVRSGLVVSCNDTRETRRAVRVRPEQVIKVIARGEETLKGRLRDISVAGAAVMHSSDTSLEIGSSAGISLVLPIDGTNRLLQIPGRVRDARHVRGATVTVFLFDLTESPREKRLLSRYVQLRQTQQELGLGRSPLWGERVLDMPMPS